MRPRRAGLFGQRRGSTAMEFAILSVPFLLFLLFLMEIGFDFYVQLALDYGVAQGAWKLETGAGNAAASAAVFMTDCMCPAVSPFLNCNQISISVQPMTAADYYTAASGGAGSIPSSGGTLNTAGFGFNPGGSNTPMFMQAIYTSVSTVGLLLPVMSMNTSAGRFHVTNSTVGWVNELFTPSSTVCGLSS